MLDNKLVFFTRVFVYGKLLSLEKDVNDKYLNLKVLVLDKKEYKIDLYILDHYLIKKYINIFTENCFIFADGYIDVIDIDNITQQIIIIKDITYKYN